MKKRFVSLLLALSMCFGLLTSAYAANASDFSDLKAGAWYMEYVPYVIETGLMDGVGGGKFAPDATLNRATFVTILGRIAGVDEAAYNTASSFSDVPEGQWYTPYVNWAAEKGISDGTGNGTFSPKREITREQMATLICRYVDAYGLTLQESDTAVSAFTDSSDVSAYAADAVELMRKTGIMVGDDAQKFSPKATATRAQAATVCVRLIAQTEEPAEEPTEEDFDSAYFADLIPKATKYVYDWYLDPVYVDKNDVITGQIEAYGLTRNFYAVNVPGITTMEALRQQSHQYYTYSTIGVLEEVYVKQAFVEQDGKLYLTGAIGLGGDSYNKIYVDSQKVSDTKYQVTVYGENYDGTITKETVNYVLEDGQWVFDDVVLGTLGAEAYTIDQMP